MRRVDVGVHELESKDLLDETKIGGVHRMSGCKMTFV